MIGVVSWGWKVTTRRNNRTKFKITVWKKYYHRWYWQQSRRWQRDEQLLEERWKRFMAYYSGHDGVNGWNREKNS